MAISAPHYHCLKELHRRGELPQGGALLEIGEANWYGDVDTPEFPPDIQQELVKLVYTQDGRDLMPHHIVKALYRWLFAAKSVLSVDLHGTSAALKYDLNVWCSSYGNPNSFSTVINHGTLEHVFDVANVLKVMHINCAVGGLLIHESPFTGWIDHGFWTIQPTLYYDLAAANGYDLRLMAVTHIDHGSAVEIHSREQLLKMAAAGGVPNNAMLFVAMRKIKDAPFVIPMQGVYAQTISEEAQQAWRELR